MTKRKRNGQGIKDLPPPDESDQERRWRLWRERQLDRDMYYDRRRDRGRIRPVIPDED